MTSFLDSFENHQRIFKRPFLKHSNFQIVRIVNLDMFEKYSQSQNTTILMV